MKIIRYVLFSLISVALVVFAFFSLFGHNKSVSYSELDKYDNNIYVSSQCPYCHMVVNYIDKNHIPVKKRYVDKNPVYYKEYKHICTKYNNGDCGVPLYVLNRSVYMGVSDILRILKEKNR